MLGDMIVSDGDPLLLVCHSLFFRGRLVICLFEQQIAYLVSSVMADHSGLERTTSREDESMNVIGNVLKILMV